MEALEEILIGIRKESKHKLDLKSLKAKGTMSFSTAPLSDNELSGLTTECEHGTPCSKYQLRALAILDDKFHADRYTGDRFTHKCVFEIPQYQPLFNEIHRAVLFYVEQGMTVKEALYKFLRSRKAEVKHEPAE